MIVLRMLSSYLSWNIHLILKFDVSLNYIRAVLSAEFQKMGQLGKILMMRI